LTLIESAIEACRQLVGNEVKPVSSGRPSKPVGFKISVPMLVILLAIILLIVLSIAGRRLVSDPKFRFSRKKRKQKIGPTQGELKEFEDEEKKIQKMLRRGGL